MVRGFGRTSCLRFFRLALKLTKKGVVSFEMPTAANVITMVCYMMSRFCPDDGNSRFLRNSGNSLQHYTVSRSKRSLCSLPWIVWLIGFIEVLLDWFIDWLLFDWFARNSWFIG
jgi:hypothetical protein